MELRLSVTLFGTRLVTLRFVRRRLVCGTFAGGSTQPPVSCWILRSNMRRAARPFQRRSKSGIHLRHKVLVLKNIEGSVYRGQCNPPTDSWELCGAADRRLAQSKQSRGTSVERRGSRCALPEHSKHFEILLHTRQFTRSDETQRHMEEGTNKNTSSRLSSTWLTNPFTPEKKQSFKTTEKINNMLKWYPEL